MSLPKDQRRFIPITLLVALAAFTAKAQAEACRYEEDGPVDIYTATNGNKIVFRFSVHGIPARVNEFASIQPQERTPETIDKFLQAHAHSIERIRESFQLALDHLEGRGKTRIAWMGHEQKIDTWNIPSVLAYHRNVLPYYLKLANFHRPGMSPEDIEQRTKDFMALRFTPIAAAAIWKGTSFRIYPIDQGRSTNEDFDLSEAGDVVRSRAAVQAALALVKKGSGYVEFGSYHRDQMQKYLKELCANMSKK